MWMWLGRTWRRRLRLRRWTLILPCLSTILFGQTNYLPPARFYALPAGKILGFSATDAPIVLSRVAGFEPVRAELDAETRRSLARLDEADGWRGLYSNEVRAAQSNAGALRAMIPLAVGVAVGVVAGAFVGGLVVGLNAK